MKNTRSIKCSRSKTILLLLGLSVLCSIIPLRLAIAQHQAPEPQAILELEGSPERINFTAQFAKSHPELPVWISGNPDGFFSNRAVLQRAGVPEQQVRYDFCATDTVTNFTCNVDTFTAQKIQHIYVITSDYHMPRSLAIAAIVLGSRGVFVTPIAVDSRTPSSESPLKTVRDCLRSILWLFTTWTGAELRAKSLGGSVY